MNCWSIWNRSEEVTDEDVASGDGRNGEYDGLRG
jgi:hypothetical protein